MKNRCRCVEFERRENNGTVGNVKRDKDEEGQG
jgi:hypothetical protein